MKNKHHNASFRIPVPSEFETVFSDFYFAENKINEPLIKSVLPNFQIILVFCFGENILLNTQKNTSITVNKCLVLGPIKQIFSYTLPSNTSILVANFKDDAFYRFFGTTCITEYLSLNADELVSENCFTNLWHKLEKIKTPIHQVNYIFDFCRPYLKNQNLTATLLSNFEDENLNPIKSIAQKINKSERSIQMKQKQQFGYNSKEMNRYQRFLKAIRMIEQKLEKSKKIEWFDIIEQCNYYDQSQLIHDFNKYLSLSPTQYLKFQEDICNPIT